MSVISSRKSLSSSILKSTASRNDSLKKTKFLRFEVNLASVKNSLIEVADNPNAKSYQDLIYRLTEVNLNVRVEFSFMLQHILKYKVIYLFQSGDLRKIIREAAESVELISKEHILLVQSILNIRWINRELDIIELYHEFIFKLMTLSNHFLVICLSKIISCFVPDDEESDLWKSGNASIELESKLKLVHKLLKKTLDLMPMLPVTLRKQLRLEFPYYKQSSFKIVAYIDNLFQIINYCPSMTYDIIELVFENMVLIDVNVPRDQIEESEELLLDDMEDEIDKDMMKLPLAETLDNCMKKILIFFRTKLKDDSEVDISNQRTIVEAMLNYFDEQIIKTHTKHVHFLLFYVASFRKTFLDDFLEYLWFKAFDRNQSSTIRQTAIGYISSFLSRARFLHQNVLKTYLKKLSVWAHTYVKTCDFQSNKSPKAHVIFYSVCQSIFYTIAFRSRELCRCNENLEFLLLLDLWPIVKHPLNPLNFCLPAVATIFDNITTKYQILFCHTIIVSNASKSLTTVYANEQHRPGDVLESVFPFDPYLLKKSGKIIQPLYIIYEPDHEVPESVISPSMRKRVRYESISGEFEDFIIRDSKASKLH